MSGLLLLRSIPTVFPEVLTDVAAPLNVNISGAPVASQNFSFTLNPDGTATFVGGPVILQAEYWNTYLLPSLAGPFSWGNSTEVSLTITSADLRSTGNYFIEDFPIVASGDSPWYTLDQPRVVRGVNASLASGFVQGIVRIRNRFTQVGITRNFYLAFN